MKFHQNAHELFRKWYVDGRIYFHKIVDSAVDHNKAYKTLETLTR